MALINFNMSKSSSVARRYTRSRKRQMYKNRARKLRQAEDALTYASKPVRLAFPGYSFIPQRVLTQLRFCDEGLISQTSNKYFEDLVYRGNSIYDPYQPVGGGQPMGRDQLATLYNSYRVHACKIKLTVTSNTGTPMRFGIIPNTSSTVFTTVLDAAEQPGAKVKALSTYTGGLSSNLIKHYVMTKSILGIKELEDDEESVMSSNPSNEWFYHLIFSTEPYTGTNYIDCAWYLELVYSVEAFDRVALSRS